MKRLFSFIVLAFVSVGMFLALTFALAPTASAATDCGSLENAQYDERVCCPAGHTSDAVACMMGKYMNPLIKVLAAIAGVAVVGGIIWGGIQYGTSTGDAQKVAKGKRTITQALVGLVAFLLLASFVQFLSPVSIATTNAKNENGETVCTGSFLGLKPWYAYIPIDRVNPESCEVSQDLPLLPTGKSVGVLPAVALAVVDNLLRIAAYVAVAFVLTGGIQYITSQGDPGRTKQAMSTILNALIGLAIAIVASALVAFLGKALMT